MPCVPSQSPHANAGQQTAGLLPMLVRAWDAQRGLRPKVQQ